MDESSGADLVRIEDLVVHFPLFGGVLRRPTGWVRAVDGINLTIRRGETLGLVGESGSGKTTLGRVLVRIVAPQQGRVEFDGEDLLALSGRELRRRRRRFQMVFQDPYASLDPRKTVRQILSEPLDIHGLATGPRRASRIAELLQVVGLDRASADLYPNQFSGGQRQRIGIARALAVEPDFIICDEPVSALDVSVRAQVIILLERLQADLGLTYLFIAHDLTVVRHIAKRVAVMYLGKIVEIGSSDDIFGQPLHPYTAALLSAIPIPNVEAERSRVHIVLGGDPPSPINPPSGCRFHPRCWLYARLGNPAICETSEPPMADADEKTPHVAACHFADQTAEAFRARAAPVPPSTEVNAQT
jgi:oligopeptide/dipeptide ABC transporter ATP-binding protein